MIPRVLVKYDPSNVCHVKGTPALAKSLISAIISDTESHKVNLACEIEPVDFMGEQVEPIFSDLRYNLAPGHITLVMCNGGLS